MPLLSLTPSCTGAESNRLTAPRSPTGFAWACPRVGICAIAASTRIVSVEDYQATPGTQPLRVACRLTRITVTTRLWHPAHRLHPVNQLSRAGVQPNLNVRKHQISTKAPRRASNVNPTYDSSMRSASRNRWLCSCSHSRAYDPVPARVGRRQASRGTPPVGRA